jgi:type IV pilus assembly protein PilY1
VQSLANTIWGKETEGSRIFIGESLSNDPSYDAAPTAKNVTSFGNIRGLSPEEPTRQGGYYAGSVAYYAKTNDLNTAAPGNQKMDTFAVALSSPLPRIEMPLANNQIITLVPFAKTVGGCVGTYMPTNTIVDFYGKIFNTGTGNVDSNINGGRPYGMFSINYEDSEYGSDHDMDAIVTYVVSVNADNTLTVALSSNYAAGGCIQHMGYVISGTTKDGVYLEVRDSDTVNDVDYFLDTPPTFTETPPAPATASGWQDGVALPLTATRTFTPGQSSAVFIKHDPLWYAAKWGGFVEGDSKNNLPDKQEEWDRDKDGKPDAYFLVTNAGMLKEQLRETFEEILSRTGSAAAVALNTGAIGAGSRVYQALFHSGDWSGNVIAYNLDAKGKPTTIAWEAAKQLSDDSSRKIITFKPSRGAGIPFRWPNDPANPGTDELDDTQVSALNGTDGQGEERLNHLRGSRTDEDPSGKQYRKRGTTVLGDIVNSNPIYVGSPTYRYPDNADFTGYPAFRTSQKGRKPVIYVGANDGMLHALDADTGQELLGYVPGMVFDNLIELTKRNYSHRYFVDGSPTVGDVYFNSSWHTVLVGSLRAGGKGIYALDVTNPASFGEDKADELVLWERTNVDYGTDGDFSEIGFSFSEPSIVRMHNGKWVAVFGNGYNSSGTAVLFIVDIEDGRLIQKIDTGETGSPNGLSTPTVIDVDGDYIVDLIYVGDLLGNLWRFDVSSSSPTLWTFAKLFTASFTSATGETKAQPITSAPEVARHPFKTTAGKDTFVVLFGTGKYLEKSDVTNTDQQTFYGIWDNEGAPVTGRSELQQQTFTTTFSDDGRTFLVSSANTVDYPSKKGWYLDLKNAGERVANDPLLVGSRIIFTSILPSDDPCSYGGTSWLNVLDAVTGGRAKETFLRMRGENAGALVLEPNTNYAPTSVQFGGISSGPSMINTSDQLVIYTSTSGGGDDSSSGSDGDDEDDGCKPGEPCDSDLSPMDDFGRQSWRQVEFQ